MVKDTVLFLHKALESGQSVLVEGANAAMLDIDFGKIQKKKKFFLCPETKEKKTRLDL